MDILFVINYLTSYNWVEGIWGEKREISAVCVPSVFTAINHSRMKLSSITTRKLSILAAPNAPRSSHPSIPWSNTAKVNTPRLSSECLMPMSGGIILVSKYSACRVSLVYKYRHGFQSKSTNTGANASTRKSKPKRKPSNKKNKKFKNNKNKME